MAEGVDLILKLKIKGGCAMFQKLIIGGTEIENELVDEINEIKAIQEELMSSQEASAESRKITDSYIYGPTYSCV